MLLEQFQVLRCKRIAAGIDDNAYLPAQEMNRLCQMAAEQRVAARYDDD